uniref:Uncharacterized protein n=1 Tax=Acanthochromis polyacanthus TaxID=80966 RepID=A0A3Q1GSQ0_9TELE
MRCGVTDLPAFLTNPTSASTKIVCNLFSFTVLTTLMAARSEQHLEVMFTVLPAFKLSEEIKELSQN